MAHNIPSYLLASGLIALGMDWVQAIMTIALGNLLVLIPMLLNSHAGTKYGIPFPVFARASFGVFGANLAAILRGLIACGWFGIQTWIGGQAIFILASSVLGDSWSKAPALWGYVAANVVSPSYDFSNAFPKLISFRTGGIITGVIGIAIQPWRLLANPQLYIFTWLEFYGGMLGAIAGVLVADYWLLRRTDLALADLYRTHGIYRYAAGWNWRAVASVGLGLLLAVGGAHSTPGGGPFPSDGIIPFLKPLYSYSWVAGFLSALLAYYLLSVAFPVRGTARPQPAVRTAGGSAG